MQKYYPDKNLTSLQQHPATLVEMLRWQAEHNPDKKIFTFLKDGARQKKTVTFRELDRRASALAAHLQLMGYENERALLLYPPGLEYIIGFLGCLYAGVVAVPAYPPNPSRLAQTLPRIEAIIANAKPALILTTTEISSMMKMVNLHQKFKESIFRNPFRDRDRKRKRNINEEPTLRNLTWLATDGEVLRSADEWKYPDISSDSLAFLQYTSGSTGIPKGVILTHGNLVHNSGLIRSTFGFNTEYEGVIWLPFYHDMGLIGGILQPMYSGMHCTLMSPLMFLASPFRWLQIISNIKDKYVISGGPNFSYELCARKVTEEQLAELDLSNWKVAFSGAEPVREETINLFAARFQSCGFTRESFYPCYGLAEATLLVSGKRPADSLRFISAPLKSDMQKPADSSPERSGEKILVGCGQITTEQKVYIVDPEKHTICPENETGEIWVSGPSVAQGYWQNTEETEEIFRAFTSDTGEGPFLRTGDLGFVNNGELFVTGRLKDLIIIRGKNHYPQDIEYTVESSHPALRPGCVAAFSIDEDDDERLVVVQEVRPGKKPDYREITNSILQRIVEIHELQPYAVVLIKAKTISKTSSGKIQRRATKAQYLAGQLTVLKETKFVNDQQTEESTSDQALEKEEEFLTRIREEKDRESLQSWVILQLSRMLNIEPGDISLEKSLMSYGLDSLMIVELKNELESCLDIDIPVNEFFRCANLNQFIDVLENLLTTGSDNGRIPVNPGPAVLSESSLSYGQRSLWFLNRLMPESAAYNVPFAVRIVSPLNIAALKKTFRIMSERHPALRTIYPAKNNMPYQLISEQAEPDFIEVDALEWSEEQLSSVIHKEAHQPFNVETGPVMRVRLYRTSEKDHVILVVFHHIAIDLWSVVVFMNELAEIYSHLNRSDDYPSQLSPIRYTDFVNWQQKYLDSTHAENALAFWTASLSGEISPLNLPLDRERPKSYAATGATFLFDMDKNTSDNLRVLARRSETTLYAALLTIFKIFLYHYTGQNDILVGSPAAGRSHSAFENIIGYFVNSIVVRTRISGRKAFTECLRAVHTNIADCLAHQDFPFPLLVEKLQPGREAGQSPLFNVMFVFQKPHLFSELDLAPFILGDSGKKIDIGDLTLESYPLQQRISQFDLTLTMIDAPDGIRASFQYNPELFEEATIASMARHFNNLASEVAVKPDEKIADFSLLSKEERINLVSGPELSGDGEISDCCYHALFEQVAGTFPEKVAVTAGEHFLTYRQLDRYAGMYAGKLKEAGIVPEARIGVLTSRSIETVIAVLAIFKAGGVYVPLDPSAPAERLKYIVGDSNISVILTHHSVPRLEFNRKIRYIFLDERTDLSGTSEKSFNPRVNVHPDHLAYIIYTSGTTGLPKGVMVSHKAFANHCKAMGRYYGYDSEDRALEFASLNFDASLEQMLTPLLSGAAVFLRDEELWPAADFHEKISQFALTMINLPPAYWQEILLEWEKDPEKVPGRHLRLCIIGGDIMPFDLVKKWQNSIRLPVRLINAYGPTETTITASAYEIPANFSELARNRRVPLGKSLAHRNIYILGPGFSPVPPRVIGEIYIGGTGVARGYFNRPELTAEKFIPDPFSQIPGQRIYSTGDRGRFLPDGNMEFHGRGDHQVKIRGIRIELHEIESVMRRFNSIKEAVVGLYDIPARGRHLVAFLVTRDNRELDEQGLRSFLKNTLPEVMVPRFYITLKELPRNSAGKADRHALPDPGKIIAKITPGSERPRTSFEKQVAEIFMEILNVKDIGIHDNFFDLGGHSLLATKIISRTREVFKVEIQLSKFFEDPTVAGLCAFITWQKTEAVDEKKLDQLLSEVENLSDDEILNLLKD